MTPTFTVIGHGPMVVIQSVVILSVVPTTTVTQVGAILIIMVITERGILVSAFIDR